MSRYVLKRLSWLVVVLVGASMLTFALGVLAPGDPAEILLREELGEPPTGEQLRTTRHELGLDRPIHTQYLNWLGDALQGDLGQSWSNNIQVSEALIARLPATAALAAAAAVLSLVIALPLGVVAAYRRNTVTDQLSRLGALLGASVPSYVLAYVLILVFGVMLGAFPVFGSNSPAHIVLPAVTLAIAVAAPLTRLTRSAMLEVLREDYMILAKAKGLKPSVLLFRDALRNALIPVVTAGTLTFAGLLNGTVIVEWVFAWPGLGKLAIDAIHARDYPIIQGFVIFTAAIYVLLNFAIDVAYSWLDPRIRDESST